MANVIGDQSVRFTFDENTIGFDPTLDAFNLEWPEFVLLINPYLLLRIEEVTYKFS